MGFEDLMVIDRRDRERTEEQIREGRQEKEEENLRNRGVLL